MNVILFTASEQSTAQSYNQFSERSGRVYLQCIDEASYFSREQIRCAFMEQQRQAELAERAYKAALTRLGPRERQKLVISQAAWQSSIDQKCGTKKLYRPEPIGTIATFEGFSCLGGEAATRVEWLERRYPRQAREGVRIRKP